MRRAIARVRIVASSGFGVDKCRVMADAKAPIDVVGTGSFIPDAWHETYATADIVEYDGVPMVKVGREFLLRKNGARKEGGWLGVPTLSRCGGVPKLLFCC